MTNEEADSLIDAQLRNVPVPTGLAARLVALSQWPDVEVDRDLAAIPVPSTLSARLKDITADAPVEEALVQVPLPAGFQRRLRDLSIPRRTSRWSSAAQRTVAASLLIALSLGYGSLAWQVLLGARNASAPAAIAHTFIQPLPMSLEAASLDQVLTLELPAEDRPAPAREANYADTTPSAPWQIEDRPRSAAPVEEILLAAGDERLHSAMYQPRAPILGAPLASAAPQLDLVRLPLPRGIRAPLLPGYDRAFLLRTGVHPPIFTVSPVLQRSLAPLSLATDAFDQALAATHTKRRLTAEQVRTEDFVAAMPHDLPVPAAGQLSLTITGATSRFGPENARLLGLGVRAGEALQRARPATHLVVAVDFSGDLARSGAWPWVRESILETLSRLGRDDRLSVLLFQNEVVVGSSPLDVSSLDLLGRRLREIEPQGLSDPLAGLAAAIDVALTAETPSGTGQLSRQVVLMSDGSFDLSVQHQNRIAEITQQAKESGIGLSVVNLSGGRSAASGPAILARAMQVEQQPIDSRRTLTHSLQKLLQGEEAFAAAEAKLTIRFLPPAISAYRLIGHESNTMAQLVTPPLVTQLHSGDESLVLFELLPSAEGKQEIVAEVELTWLELPARQLRTIKRRIHRSELSQPWNNSPATFRAATLAAEGAEQLRGSRAALRDLGWKPREAVDLAVVLRQARTLLSSDRSAPLEQLTRVLDHAVKHP